MWFFSFSNSEVRFSDLSVKLHDDSEEDMRLRKVRFMGVAGAERFYIL